MTTLIYRDESIPEMIDRYLDALYERHLRYTTADLFREGIRSYVEIDRAVGRASRALRLAGLVPREHVRATYMTGAHGECLRIWRLSETAYRLALLNAGPFTPSMARRQMRIIEMWKKGKLG